MYLIKAIWVASLLVSLSASAGYVRPAGEDPYPMRCVSLQGIWLAEDGEVLSVVQEGCRKLVLKRNIDDVFYTSTVKTDGLSISKLHGADWTLTEKYGWNSMKTATTLNVERSFVYADHSTQEHATLQALGPNTLLQVRRQINVASDGSIQKHTIRKKLHRAP